MEDQVQTEMSRLELEDTRKKRIRQREKQIYEELNPVKRTILQARQFLDEVQQT